MAIALGLLMIGVMLGAPGAVTEAARDAMRVWGLDVAPSLFPYMVFCRLIASRLRQSGMPAMPAAALLGMLGGSPSGAAVVSVYGRAGNLSRRQTLMLAAFTGTISPMFLLSTTRAWLGNTQICRLLMAAHGVGALFAWAVAAVLIRESPGARTQAAHPLQDSASGDPIAESVQSILGVGGCIVFFSVLAACVRVLLPGLPAASGALIHAVLEIAGGMHALCTAPLPPTLRAVIMAAASGFSGLSILMQNRLFLRPLGVSLRHLIGFGLVRAAGAGAAMWAMLAIFP